MDLKRFNQFSNYKEEVTTKNEVWIYTRVSSKQQFDNNESVAHQDNEARKLATERDYRVTKTFGGTYESAKGDFSRKEFSRLIDEVRKSRNKPYAILIFKMSRFSRTGGSAVGLVDELVKKLGVHLIEVRTGKDTTTPRGEIDINTALLHAQQEQIERMEFTLPGMVRFLKKGNWLGVVPRGYDHYGSKVKRKGYLSEKQEIIINEEGRNLKMAWRMKLDGENDHVIIEALRLRGMNVSKGFISEMWRKPFYCGIIVNALLKDEVVKGNWEPLVSPKDFLTINDKLNNKSNVGYQQSKFPENRPLQTHLVCGQCGGKFTGYKAKKKYDYYKCQCKGCCKDMNATTTKNAKGLNDLFQGLLENIELKDKYVAAFKAQLQLTISNANKGVTEKETILKKELGENTKKLKSMERRYAIGELEKCLFEEYRAEFEENISKINTELDKIGIQISNLDLEMNNCVDVLKNVSKIWKSGGIHEKIKLQNVVFPTGIVIDPKKRQYRTDNLNLVFREMSTITGDKEHKTKNPPVKITDGSALVAGARLELTTFGL
ncbi:MAG: recombinase family protein [Flavobacteriales bacterium]|nr:recombinase family protein [Flavobacteriales bacterium]